MSTSETFETVLLETVEKTLVDVLGEKIVAALRFYVDLRSAMTNLDSFMTLMSHLVGPRQSEILRVRIAQELYSRYGVAYERGPSLSEDISKLKSEAKRSSD